MRGTVTLTLYGIGLSSRDREQILDYLFETLKIAPGMVSADGNYELILDLERGSPETAPTLNVDGREFERISPERLRALFPARGPRPPASETRLRR